MEPIRAGIDTLDRYHAEMLKLTADARVDKAPIESPTTQSICELLLAYFGVEIQSHLAIGPNGGVLITLSVPRTDVWVRAEYLTPNEERDYFEVVAPLIPFRLACAILVVAPATLYARAPYMASSVKRGGRLFFQKSLFYSVDLAEESRLPLRKEVIATREHRRSTGEVLRAGSHKKGCPRRHISRCHSASVESQE